MWKRFICRLLHRRGWGCLDSRCYEEGSTGLIQLVFNHCEKCNLYMPVVFRIRHAGAKTERIF